MEGGRIPKDLLYRELSEGTRPADYPKLHFKDIVQQGLKKTRIEVEKREDKASARSFWRSAIRQGVQGSEVTREALAAALR